MDIYGLLAGIVVTCGVFAAGYYAKVCPNCTPPPITEISKPALAVQEEASKQLETLQATIKELQAEAANRPKTRTIEIVKEVPGECQSHVARQAVQDASKCLEAADLELINLAQDASRAVKGD